MKQVKGMASAQGGFTLVEIAIVLVIVGLLLGGVLQGQQLIENSRVRSAINEVNGITAAVTAYQDRYGRLPGDDGPAATLIARGGTWVQPTAMTGGNADGILTGGVAVGTLLTAAPTAEPLAFWRHLRAAGFISGDPGLAAGTTVMPTNPFGGNINVTSVLALDIPANVTKLCMNNVPASAGRSIDQRLDDGNPATGRVRSVEGALTAAAGTTTYVDGTLHSLCVRL